MRKMITCSFDEVGVRMTAWNGIHPDRIGSYSTTVEMNRTQFNDACKNRAMFGEMLGINITEGWQNALLDAIKNASPLKVDFLAASKMLVEKITERFVLEHGEEEGMKKATAFFDSIDVETETTEELIKKAMIAVAGTSMEKSLVDPVDNPDMEQKKESQFKNDYSEDQMRELELLFVNLAQLDPNYERTGFETIEEVGEMINSINAKNNPKNITYAEAETTKENENEEQGRIGTSEEKPAKGGKKSRSKNIA